MSDENLQKAIEYAAAQINDLATCTYVRSTLQTHFVALVLEQERRAKAKQS